MSGTRNAFSTVVIPVFNGEQYLEESLLSVSNQICSYDFDVLVLNDGSTDRSVEIALDFASRFTNFKVLDLPKLGLVGVLNRALEVVETKYISRHDADDIMVENRIEIQIQQILENPEINCVGGQIKAFSGSKQFEELKVNFYPLGNMEIKSQLMRKNVFASPTVTYCRNCALKLGGYRSLCDGAEDYDLWLRMAARGAMRNDSSILTLYRIHSEQVTQSKKLKVYRATFLAKIFSLVGSELGLKKPKLTGLDCHLPSDFSRNQKLSLLYFLALDFLRFIRVTFTPNKVRV